MTANIFLTLSIALLSGLLLSRVAKKVGLPAVTAYLVAGVLIGPYLLGQLGIGFNHESTSPENFKILCDLALGFIAFAIGNEFRLEQLKKIGKKATIWCIDKHNNNPYRMYERMGKPEMTDELIRTLKKEGNVKPTAEFGIKKNIKLRFEANAVYLVEIK